MADHSLGWVTRHLGVGRQVIAAAQDGARRAGCEWLHVDLDGELTPFCVEACGFRPASAGLMALGRRSRLLD